MSIFWIGGPNKIIPDDEIRPEMYEDRIFLPGVIHGGEDYLIRVYLNDVRSEGEPDEFVAEYLTRSLILKAHDEDPSHEWPFEEILTCEAENFACYNDGSGDFASLVEAWPEAVVMSNADLVDWAKGKPKKKPVVDRRDLPELLGQIIDIFEDFLEEKGIDIPNPEKDERETETAIIYGTDYGMLQSDIEETLISWGITEKE